MNILILGATSTIAQDIAKLYANQSNSLFLVGRNSNLLSAIKQDLEVRGAKQVRTLSSDLNQFSEIGSLFEAIEKEAGVIDVALLCHGILGDQELAEQDFNEILNIVNSNYLSHAVLMNSLAALMKKQQRGTIAVLCSVAGDRGKQSNYIYGSAQAAKATYADGLRNRLFKHNIHVVTIKLGFVDTAMTRNFKKGPLWAESRAVAKGVVRSIENKSNKLYLPFFWRYIMMIIASVPERIFKKLSL